MKVLRRCLGVDTLLLPVLLVVVLPLPLPLPVLMFVLEIRIISEMSINFRRLGQELIQFLCLSTSMTAIDCQSTSVK